MDITVGTDTDVAVLAPEPPAFDPRLWLLLSPALPVGGYSYSQGLEYAVHAAWINDFRSAGAWILGLAEHSVARVDLPIIARLDAAIRRGDVAGVALLNARLLASRESFELAQEDERMGAALARLLSDLLGHDAPGRAALPAKPAFATAFASACVAWEIPAPAACAAYLWVWGENQTAAAVKLVPLGHTQGQRLLLTLAGRLAGLVDTALALGDDEIGMTMPGLGIASARHETQYSRLFQS